jgi:hypothetical protein
MRRRAHSGKPVFQGVQCEIFCDARHGAGSRQKFSLANVAGAVTLARTVKERIPINLFAVTLACALAFGCASASNDPPVRILHKTVDLQIGEAQDVRLSGGTPVRVKLLNLREHRDDVNGAVRRAEVEVEVDGAVTNLISGTYHLPVTFGKVQIDCPVTKGYLEKAQGGNPWGLVKDARLRLWPAGSPWIAPHTFVYPARQRWFASYTQMANEPVYVDGGELPA